MRQALSETWLVFLVEVWPNIGASFAAGLTDEQRPDIGEPNIVGAVDQQAANAQFAKLAECDFCSRARAMSLRFRQSAAGTGYRKTLK
jgi:hypothetical protein